MDRLIKTLAFDGQVRIVAIQSADIVSKALNIHKLSPTATGALGRFLTVGAIMGAMLKSSTDKLTLIMKGDGPMGNMVVCANSNAIVKGYVQDPNVDVPLNSAGKIDVGRAVGKTGKLTVIKDIGMKDPYSGSVDIVSGEIGDEFAKYFSQSEQIPSVVALGVSVNNKGEVPHAGGYILQLMPQTDTEIIDMIEGRIQNIKPVTTLLKEGYTLEEIIKAVTGDENIAVLEEIAPKFECDCTRERMESAIASISKEERERMIEEDGCIEVKCSFCTKKEIWNK